MSFLKEIFLDSFLDATKLLPLLFIIYLAVEYAEHKNNSFVHKLFLKSQKTGAFLGAFFGNSIRTFCKKSDNCRNAYCNFHSDF